MRQNIKIIQYGAGNIASVKNAISALGENAGLASTPEDLFATDKLIFPGVGHAKPAMEKLKSSGMDEAIKTFTGPVLGICLGMQLMATSSEEGEMKGMEIFPARVSHFPPGMKVPHMGWNSLHELRGPLFKNIKAGSHVYFVHSFSMPKISCSIASSQYGENFSAAVAKANFFGVQFHPEKSGAVGQTILKNFLAL